MNLVLSRHFVDSDEDNDSSGAVNEISHKKFCVLSFLSLAVIQGNW